VLSCVLFGEGDAEFKNHGTLALGASGKPLVAQESNFVRETMLPVPDPVYSTPGTISSVRNAGLLDHFAWSGFYQMQRRRLVPHFRIPHPWFK
jgi:hypothetical protein